MIADPVTTITLTAGTPQSVKFASSYPFYWIDNKTSGNVYARIGGTPVPDSDGTFTIAAGSQLRVSGGAFDNDITLLGSGKVQIIASELASCPFKLGSKGGGNEISGAPSYSVDAVDYPLLGLNIFGKSVQDGEPSPDAPVDIISVGDNGTVNITSNNGADVSVTASITSALPLCGIPVESGGNYTDSRGQQWVCDELIYNADGTGKIIKRINKTVFNGSENWRMTPDTKYAYFSASTELKAKFVSSTTKAYLFSNKYTATSAAYFLGSGKMCMTFDSMGNLMISDERFIDNINGLKADMAANNLIVVYALAEPQEIELTAVEISALKVLQTFDGTTSISNSAGAEMSVKYCTSKALSEFVLPITKGLQAQIDELRAAVLSLGGNV